MCGTTLITSSRWHRCNNDGKFSLAACLNDIPRYTIPSHTWGAEEVTLADLTNGNGKIHICGEQAKRDNLRYFWGDTCCIDKSNNAEAAKAINSLCFASTRMQLNVMFIFRMFRDILLIWTTNLTSLGNRCFGKADGSLEVRPGKSLLRRYHLDFS